MYLRLCFFSFVMLFFDHTTGFSFCSLKASTYVYLSVGFCFISFFFWKAYYHKSQHPPVTCLVGPLSLSLSISLSVFLSSSRCLFKEGFLKAVMCKGRKHTHTHTHEKRPKQKRACTATLFLRTLLRLPQPLFCLSTFTDVCVCVCVSVELPSLFRLTSEWHFPFLFLHFLRAKRALKESTSRNHLTIPVLIVLSTPLFSSSS